MRISKPYITIRSSLYMLSCVIMAGFILACRETHQPLSSTVQDTKLTWWCTNRAADFGMTMDQLPVFSRLQEETAIDITFIHPPAGQYNLRFQLMLTTGQLPDIISHDFLNDYPGSIAGALSDEVIVAIGDDLLAHAPYLSAYFAESPHISEQLQTIEGRYFCVPSLNIDERTTSYMGPFVRRDLLEKHGLPIPETLTQWETVLETFAGDPIIDIPFTFYGGNFRDTRFFIGSYGIAWDFFLRDGRIAYGPLEPEFRSFLQRLRTWFQNNWLDPGVVFNNLDIYRKQIDTKNIGIYVDYVSNIINYENTIRDTQPEATLEPVTYPSLEGRQLPVLGHDAGLFVSFASAYLSRRNNKLNETMRLLDYAYSPEGRLLFNYGIEGESYTVQEGRPVIRTQLFSAEGKPMPIKMYIVSGPYAKDPDAFMQMLHTDTQKRAVDLWSATQAKEHRMPLMIPDEEQSAIISRVTRSIDNYVEDMIVEFVTAERSMSEFDSFRDTLMRMGIQDVLDVYNEIYRSRWESAHENPGLR